ncbi:MAG: hypothetical protein JW944_03930 [Deltaproteobacteria bacterium]|nr:hypothetical protein [Deltaproteobacteria bacterium]
MKKSVISLIVITAVCMFGLNGYAADIEGINIHGFLSQGYVKTTENNLFTDTIDGTFEFNEFGINFSKDLTDNLRLGIQFFAKDYGTSGNDEVEVDWAYGDYRFKDWLGFRAGKIKVPHGLYNQTRDVDMLRTSIFLPQSVYPEVLRESTLAIIGGGVYGNIDLKILGGLSYQAALGTQNIKASERTKQAFMDATSNNDMIETTSIDVDSKYAGSLVWDTPLDGLRISGTYGDTKLSAVAHAVESDFMMDIGDRSLMDFDKFQYTVYSAEYIWNNLTLAAEYMETERSISMSMPDSAMMMGAMTEELESEGWYASASYRFIDWFSLGAYYAKTETGNGGAGGGGGPVGVAANDSGRDYRDDLCLTTRFDINEYMVFKLEGHNLEGTNGLSALDAVEDSDGNMIWTNEWKMFSAKVTFSF